MIEKNVRDDPETFDENPLKTITKDSLLKLHRVLRQPPTEAQARIVRGGGNNAPTTFGHR
jgi:hypothetical protein